MKPNLYIAGVPKAATSAIAGCLGAHPQISKCRIKEPNFHCSDLNLPGPKTEGEYLSLFEVSKNAKYLLDASILSLYSKKAAHSIFQYVEDPRIIVVLRNPVDVMYSWHGQMLYSGSETIKEFEKALDAEADRKKGHNLPSFGVVSQCPELLYYSDIVKYSEQIERYLTLFDEQQLFISFYDDFKENPDLFFSKILDFLGIDKGFTPDFKVSNSSKKGRKSWVFHYLLKRFFADFSRAALPSRLRLDLINLYNRLNYKEQTRSPLDKQMRAALQEKMRPDVEKLCDMLGRDLGHWYQR